MHVYKIYQCFRCWRVDLPAWSDEAQAICAVSFGRGDDSCNIALANHVAEKARRYHQPYCVQGEIAQYMDPAAIDHVSPQSSDVHGRGYVGTYETVRDHVERFFRPRAITRIHVEAHPEHAWRVVRCYEMCGVRVVSLGTKDKPYPCRSTQSWCRSKLRFVPYEIVARLIYLRRGYI